MKRPLSIVMAATALLLSLALNACASAPTPSTTAPPTAASGTSQTTTKADTKAEAKPAAQAPKYGGVIRLPSAVDVTTFNDAAEGGPVNPIWTPNEELWGGDWTKGPAGGYGTKETDWAIASYDIFAHKAGVLAESWKIDVDTANQQGTIVYKLRPGVRYAVNPNSEAAKLVGGREVTVNDVISSIKQATSDSRGYLFRGYPQLRNKVNPVQTGPMEITIKVPLADLVTTVSALGDKQRIFPEEIRKLDTADWKNQVGTGPFMLTDYVAGSSITMKKNPNYWMKDPIGPGKGNQLPYVDEIQTLIIPDASTRLTAFRTGKIDRIFNLSWEDAEQLEKQAPQALSVEGGYYSMLPIYMRTDKAPYKDIRVRRALTMAIDFNTIKQSINGGRGTIITYPYEYYKEYADLYVGIDDPDMPASVKELYTYNPEKAKQLLAEAGYPNGFKASVLMPASETSYYEMIVAMWKKVGVDAALDVKEPPVISRIVDSEESYEHMVNGPGKGPVGSYHVGTTLTGKPGFSNTSFINDPVVEETLPKIRVLAITDPKEGFKLARNMVKHVLDQAYVIGRPSYRTSTFWWPWLRNYSGEESIGFINNPNWATYVWVDQDMKKSMGY